MRQKNGRKIITFGKIEIEKCKFHYCKDSIFLEDVDTDKILLSNVVSSSEENCKYFIIGYKDDLKIRSFYLILSKMRGRAKNFSGDIGTSLLIADDKLLE